jgi:tetratricopeptide (TPR) repeat protein
MLGWNLRGCFAGVVAVFVATSIACTAAVANDARSCDSSLNNFDAGIAACSRIIRERPKTYKLSHAYGNRAAALYGKGERDAALADINEAIQLAPTLAPAYNVRALILRDRGEYDKAIADLTKAISIDPAARYYGNRGDIARLKGDLNQSLRDVDKALTLHKKSSLLHTYRGNALRYLGRLPEAVEAFESALRIAPDYVAAYVGRGLTYEKQADFVRGAADFRKALSFPADNEKYDTTVDAQQTARARIAALESGAAQPAIPSLRPNQNSTTSIQTAEIEKPISPRPATQPASAALRGRRIALIIGNSAYKSVGALANPQKDAEVIASSLRNIGFEKVELVSDASREGLVNTLRAFAEESEKADWALVYYAGHGIELNGANYLVPVDAKLAADRDVQFEAVPLDQVMASVEGAKKLKVVILDACRDNPFQIRKTAVPEAVAQRSTAGGVVASRSIGRGLGEVKVSGATLVVYAAKHGQIALDGEGGNSPFAVALVQRVATPGVEINKIFRLIRDDVMEATAGRQEPFTYGSLPGREDFFFVSGK